MSLRCAVCVGFLLSLQALPVHAEGDWEVTIESEEALERGLAWLARNQGPDGNWETNDLGLVSMGALAFLAAGHLPGRGPYGEVVEKALDYVLRHARNSGLLNISNAERDMYNHGLSAFVLGQAYGMSGDPRTGSVLDRALELIARTQCDDGGWDYRARRQRHGHDLSLAVMQAKALRSAVDSGLEVSPAVVRRAIENVRGHYRAESGTGGEGGGRDVGESISRHPGQFTYDGSTGSLAMAACGVVCLQEFGEYDDWRIPRNMEIVSAAVGRLEPGEEGDGRVPFDAYTLYYVGQAIYQTGGRHWRDGYPRLRDLLVRSQARGEKEPSRNGHWSAGKHVSGKPGELYGTAVACFILAIPNRYLPILQEGHEDD